MRPPVQKIGRMAAPQRGGLVVPMPAFAAGGPMPDPAAPLVTSLEYVVYDDSPQQVGADLVFQGLWGPPTACSCWLVCRPLLGCCCSRHLQSPIEQWTRRRC